MTPEEFISFFKKDIENNENAFINNMKHGYLYKTDHSYCEWVDVFISWMEWSNREDCLRQYKRRG
jgi:c-di-AMP phosphodiesterase-like protein